MAAVGFVFSFGVFFPVFMEHFNEDRERTGMYADAVLVNSDAYDQCVKPCFQQCFKACVKACFIHYQGWPGEDNHMKNLQPFFPGAWLHDTMIPATEATLIFVTFF